MYSPKGTILSKNCQILGEKYQVDGVPVQYHGKILKKALLLNFIYIYFRFYYLLSITLPVPGT